MLLSSRALSLPLYLYPSNILFAFDFIERKFFQNTLFYLCHTLKGYAKEVVFTKFAYTIS